MRGLLQKRPPFTPRHFPTFFLSFFLVFCLFPSFPLITLALFARFTSALDLVLAKHHLPAIAVGKGGV
jgi:hypothetical protein